MKLSYAEQTILETCLYRLGAIDVLVLANGTIAHKHRYTEAEIINLLKQYKGEHQDLIDKFFLVRAYQRLTS